ncbi:LysE family translocator [Actinomycetospora cinnamomea]|uniref:Threonine/homoserine/homoserine lactone efflux protein n=1 Tax=Actinomycetospora cinnamomea TaxID=663609 RepID=A0A2U1E9Z6_9PSEU|nr:LysE family translocator [Actinomycetospora cinnamomea]PVY96702.1 threonine/homoserine/homoserine lactone efflux protein [Actinomycetospora cinnamomea]
MSERLVAFFVAAVVFIAVPGPSVVFAIGRALIAGRRRALCSVIGNTAGIGLQVVGVAVGLGAVLERSAVAFTVVKLAGAAYLVILGVTAIRRRHRAAAVLAAPGPEALPGWRRCIVDGVVVGALNPKSALFFVAFLPQFADPGGAVGAQILTLGLVVVTLGLVLDSVWALSAGTARAWFARSPRRLAALGAAGGVTMVGLGVGLATTSRTP